MTGFEAILVDQIQRSSVVDMRAAPAHISATPEWYRPLTRECFLVEAQRQNLEPWRLLAILKTENGRVGTFSRNTNGSYDMGPMQVNTIHLEELSKVFKVPTSRVAQLLAYDGCFNVSVGAWMLRKRTNEAGGDFWFGIGRYHNRDLAISRRYILQVHRNMMDIVGNKVPSKV